MISRYYLCKKNDMSKINELKSQHSWENISIVDICAHINPSTKSKYTELLFLLIKEKLDMRIQEWGSDKSTLIQDSVLSEVLWVSQNLIKLYQDFVNYSEQKLINADYTKLKSFDDLINLVSLAELKSLEKEISSSVLKLLDTDEWLVLIPFTHEASLRYGSQTRWCTASKDNPNTFYNYSQRGVLIYCIDKRIGAKYGVFTEYNLSELTHVSNGKTMYYPEVEKRKNEPSNLSFWNAKDDRIDSLDTTLTNEVFDIIKKYRSECLTSAEIFGIENFNEARTKSIKSYEEMYTSTKVKSYENVSAEQALTELDEVVYGRLTTPG